MLTSEEQSLLFVAIAYLTAVAIWLGVLRTRANMLLGKLRDGVDGELWAELGAPETMRDTLKDPKRRWWRFVRSGEYRKRLSRDLIDEIDDYRRRANLMLIVLGAGGVLIFVRYWALLKPSFL